MQRFSRWTRNLTELVALGLVLLTFGTGTAVVAPADGDGPRTSSTSRR